jgi:hypothetical protein
MTNEAQKEAGTEAFPSLLLSLFFSFFFIKKNHFINVCVYECAFLHARTSNENFSPITTTLLLLRCAYLRVYVFVLFLVEHQANVRIRTRRRRRKKKE